MVYPTDLAFNSQPANIMHLDINSCFATIEQQANPLLRGKPVAVAAYVSPSGCILAASIEAKKLGVKTGMRVKDGRALCPELIVMDSDPEKYRRVHMELRQLLSEYSDKVTPKSIDEFLVELEGYPSFKQGWEKLGLELKKRINKEIGDWIKVSIGFGASRFLAKTASNFHKPNGLFQIDQFNYQQVYSQMRNS